MKPHECLISEVARVMSAQPDLKAVTLDAANRQVSLAWQGSASTRQTQTEEALRSLVKTFPADHVPDCVQDKHNAFCSLCEASPDLHIPPGIRLTPQSGSVLLEKESCITAPSLWHWRQFPWFTLHTLAPHDHDSDHDDHDDDHDHAHGWRLAMTLALACGLAAITGGCMCYFDLMPAYSTTAFVLAYILGGWLQVGETWELLRRRIVDVHFLMLAVAAGAAAIGHWQEGAILLFLFSFSGALEAYAMDRTKREIKSLFKSAPKQAVQILPDGSEAAVAVEKIQPGMILRVKPGDQFPVDAAILSGETAADESNLTGESLPQDKKPGDFVLAGTLNLWGRVDVKATRPAGESSLSKIIRLIKDAQSSKAPSQRFTDKFGTAYTVSILALTVVMFFVWWQWYGLPAFSAEADQRSAFYNAMTLLVVGSPCALVLSIPSAILAGIAAGARHGVLFRGGVAIENLAQITRVALDKTGTITTGQMRVEEVEASTPESQDVLLAAAAALAQNSTHPVSRALVFAARARGLRLPEVADFRSHAGAGISGTIAGPDGKPAYARLGRRSFLGNPDWLQRYPAPSVGVTETCFECGPLRGRVLLKDEIRSSSRPLFQKLSREKLQLTMLTGDQPSAAQSVCRQVGLNDFVAHLKPEEKVAQIQAWTKQGERVAMVGDGVNDAPSLAAAHVGVAMGIRGSDAALEQADVVLMQDRLENFFFAYRLSQKARRIIFQNIAISLGTVVLLVLAALGAQLPLSLGVLGHEGSTVVVVFNSLRLLFTRNSP